MQRIVICLKEVGSLIHHPLSTTQNPVHSLRESSTVKTMAALIPYTSNTNGNPMPATYQGMISSIMLHYQDRRNITWYSIIRQFKSQSTFSFNHLLLYVIMSSFLSNLSGKVVLSYHFPSVFTGSSH